MATRLEQWQKDNFIHTRHVKPGMIDIMRGIVEMGRAQGYVYYHNENHCKCPANIISNVKLSIVDDTLVEHHICPQCGEMWEEVYYTVFKSSRRITKPTDIKAKKQGLFDLPEVKEFFDNLQNMVYTGD